MILKDVGKIDPNHNKAQQSAKRLGMGLANERRRYRVTSFLIGWVDNQTNFCAILGQYYEFLPSRLISLILSSQKFLKFSNSTVAGPPFADFNIRYFGFETLCKTFLVES